MTAGGGEGGGRLGWDLLVVGENYGVAGRGNLPHKSFLNRPYQNFLGEICRSKVLKIHMYS